MQSSRLEITFKKFISKAEDPSVILYHAAQFRQSPHNLLPEPHFDQPPLLPSPIAPLTFPQQPKNAVSSQKQSLIEEELRIRIELLEEEVQMLHISLDKERNLVQDAKNELGKRNREISNLNLQVETLSLHLQSFRDSDSLSFLHTKKDRVMETEALKTRLSRAERERDSLQFHLQEMERRTALQQEEEQLIREEFASRHLENERKLSGLELARQRAEAEAHAARQQLDHWKSAARYAQEELARIRAQKPATASFYSMPPVVESNNDDIEAANQLLRRQQQLQPTQQPPLNQQRLHEISAEIRRLEEEMESFGSERNRTFQQRVAREKLRRRIEELNREAQTLVQS